MTQKSGRKSSIAMYGLRFFNAVWRGGDYSFIVINMIFGLFFASLTGNPLLIVGLIFVAFCVATHLYKNIREERSDQNKLKKLKKIIAQIPNSAKLLIDQEKKNKKGYFKQTVGVCWVFIKKAWNRTREFVSAFNDGVKLLISLAMVLGFSFCGLTPILSALHPIIAALIIIPAVIYGISSFTEYHLKRRRKSKIHRMEKTIRKAREIELGIYNPYEKKPAYIPTSQENFYNSLKLVLAMIPSFFAGTFFGFSVLVLVFGYIFKPLTYFIPGLPLITDVLIPSLSAISFGIVFLIKSARDEWNAQKDEAKVQKKYYHRLNILKKLYNDRIPPEVEKRINPSPPQDNSPFAMKLIKTSWVLLQKLGNRLLDATRGTRNVTRLIQFVLSITFISVSFGVCGVSTGILGALGPGILIAVGLVGLTIGGAAFIQSCLQSNRRAKNADTINKTSLIEKEIEKKQKENNDNKPKIYRASDTKILWSESKNARNEKVSGFSFNFFENSYCTLDEKPCVTTANQQYSSGSRLGLGP